MLNLLKVVYNFMKKTPSVSSKDSVVKDVFVDTGLGNTDVFTSPVGETFTIKTSPTPTFKYVYRPTSIPASPYKYGIDPYKYTIDPARSSIGSWTPYGYSKSTLKLDFIMRKVHKGDYTINIL